VAAGAKGMKVGGIANVVERAHGVREAVGPEVDLMCDLHGPPWLAPADAVAIGRPREPLNLLVLDQVRQLSLELTSATVVGGFRHVRGLSS
jgi:galactonate dehydratase